MLMRGKPQKNAAAHRGEWQKSASGSTEIRGKTLGIVGYGHIGSQLGIIAENLGMRVIFQDIESQLPLGNAEVRSSLDALLKEADVISLHVPDTAETRNLMSASAIAAMRKGSYLINASRGTVIDIDALSEALKSGHVASKLIRYSDNGTTRSAVNFPQVSLPDHGETRRIMHIHRNEPGVLQSINQIFFDKQINIAA
jgi:D-3-phosphoglycerate dehydrogenase